MTTMAQKERLTDLRAALELTRNWRRPYEAAWTDYHNLFTGRVGRQTIRSIDMPYVNIAFSTVRTVVAGTTIGDVTWEPKPRRPQEGPRAVLVKHLLDSWWEAYRVQRKVAASVQDAAVIGHGWLATAWEYADVAAEEPDAELYKFMLQNVAAWASAGAPPEQLPTDAELWSFARRQSVRVLRDEPRVRRVSPWLLWVDAEATDVDVDARWIAELSIRSYDELKRDERFSKAARDAVNPTQRPNVDLGMLAPTADRNLTDALKRVFVWTMWDIERREVTIWAEGHEDKPLWGPKPVGPEHERKGHPYRMVPAFPINDELYPMGFVELIAPFQTELNRIRRDQFLARDMQKEKFLARKHLLSDDFVEQLESDAPYVVIGVEDDDVDLQRAFMRLPTPQVSPELYQQGAMILGDLDRMTGITSYAQGGAPAFRTATEVNAVTSYAGARAQELMGFVQDTMREVARDLIGLARHHMNGTEWISMQLEYGLKLPAPPRERLSQVVFDSDNNQLWYPWTGSDLAGEFEYRLSVGSAPEMEARKAAEATQLAQSLMPFVQAGVVDVVELARTIATNFGVADVDKLIPVPAGQVPGQMPGGPPGGPGGPGGPMLGIPSAAGGQAPPGGGPQFGNEEAGRQAALEAAATQG